MKTIYEYLIKPHGDRYNNVKKIGDKELIINATIDEKDFKFTNRIGEIIATPRKQGYLEVGDLVIVHHNTFRRWYNVRGKLRDSSNLVKEDCFSADLDQIYAYKRNGEWKTLEDYCFIKPMPKKIGKFYTEGIYEPLMGTVKFTNNILEQQGVRVGDLVRFQENCEYKFEIDGEVLYKMSALRDVKLILDEFREDKRRETQEA